MNSLKIHKSVMLSAAASPMKINMGAGAPRQMINQQYLGNQKTLGMPPNSSNPVSGKSS